MPDFVSPLRTTLPDTVTHKVYMVGTGATVPTKLEGAGVTITRTSEGLLKLTWSSNPGTFRGFTWGLNATTQADVKGHTVTGSVYPLTAGTFTWEVNIWDSAFATEDLEALEWLTLNIDFEP